MTIHEITQADRRLADALGMTTETDPNALVEQALFLATSAHRGQVDKAGEPYIWHPIRVAMRVAHPLHKVVALLHDTVEDTDTTLALIRHFFGAEIAEAVDAISHRPGERRHDYYDRVRANPMALRVKLADIDDNLDPKRLAQLPTSERERLQDKYAKALRVLAK